MVELKECVGENTQRRALINTLNQIRERSQPQFTNPLTVVYYEPDPYEWVPGHHSFFYIAEVSTKYLFGIFPQRQRRKLFAINPGFYGGAYGKKEINCAVFDRSLLDIVKGEINKYADIFQATSINLTQDFDS